MGVDRNVLAFQLGVPLDDREQPARGVLGRESVGGGRIRHPRRSNPGASNHPRRRRARKTEHDRLRSFSAPPTKSDFPISFLLSNLK